LATPRRQIGLWLVGAAGNIATTVAIGLAVLRRQSAGALGLMTQRPPLSKLDLVPLRSITLGGHEISRRKVIETAKTLRTNSGLFDDGMLRAARQALSAYERNIRPGSVAGCGRAIDKLATRANLSSETNARRIIHRFRRDLRLFARRNRLHRVVVIHVASTEPIKKLSAIHESWAGLSRALATRRTSPLPASSLYAVAAIEEGMPYVNFTPSLGVDVPAIRELAAASGVPIMGSDGKTGETLLKTVLAPMFRERHLKIESWVGHNVLGNGDGRILASPANKAAKLRNKDRVIAAMLGYRPQTRTSIEYVESQYDWKTAWDRICFRGFLGTRMSLQFTWQGSDSILAAPLVIDLARLADYHAERGRGGVMTHLACFFKSPMGGREHGFTAQVEMLHRYVAAN